MESWKSQCILYQARKYRDNVISFGTWQFPNRHVVCVAPLTCSISYMVTWANVDDTQIALKNCVSVGGRRRRSNWEHSEFTTSGSPPPPQKSWKLLWLTTNVICVTRLQFHYVVCAMLHWDWEDQRWSNTLTQQWHVIPPPSPLFPPISVCFGWFPLHWLFRHHFFKLLDAQCTPSEWCCVFFLSIFSRGLCCSSKPVEGAKPPEPDFKKDQKPVICFV